MDYISTATARQASAALRGDGVLGYRTDMASCYRLHIRLYPDRYRPHREIVDFLMEVQKKGQRNMIGRHVEQALLAHIRAEREAVRQQIEWPISGSPVNPSESSTPPPVAPSRAPLTQNRKPRLPDGADQDAWTYKDEDIPDITDAVPISPKPRSSTDASSRFSSLAQRIHQQLEGTDSGEKK